MDLEGLRIFTAVARCGGITRAARTLHTVQSNVTAHVRQMERDLGVVLFERHSRGVSLTPAGRRLLDYAERIAHMVDDARRATTDDPSVAASLSLGALETTAAVRLPPILASFTRSYPNVDLSLQTGTTGQLIDRVVARSIEGAFVAGPVRNAALNETEVLVEELVLVTRPGVDIATALGRDESDRPKAIVFRAGCSYRQRLESLLVRRGIPNPRWLEFGTLDGIIGCVAAGLGVTLLPRAAVMAVGLRSKVGVHTLPPSVAKVATVFITRRDAYHSEALQRFIACALREAGSEHGKVAHRGKAA